MRVMLRKRRGHQIAYFISFNFFFRINVLECSALSSYNIVGLFKSFLYLSKIDLAVLSSYPERYEIIDHIPYPTFNSEYYMQTRRQKVTQRQIRLCPHQANKFQEKGGMIFPSSSVSLKLTY